jgi:hypothetical protein
MPKTQLSLKSVSKRLPIARNVAGRVKKKLAVIYVRVMLNQYQFDGGLYMT